MNIEKLKLEDPLRDVIESVWPRVTPEEPHEVSKNNVQIINHLEACVKLQEENRAILYRTRQTPCK